jgi:hypothetical protein
VVRIITTALKCSETYSKALNNSSYVEVSVFTAHGVFLNVIISAKILGCEIAKYIYDRMCLFLRQCEQNAAARVRKLVSLKFTHGLGQQTTRQSCYYMETLSIRTCLRHYDVCEQCCYLQVVPYFTTLIVHRVLTNMLTVPSYNCHVSSWP